jgi:MFS family permease
VWFETLRNAINEVRRQPLLAALLAYGAMLPGTAFFIPFVLFQPQMQAQGVPVGWLGVLFTALRLAALLGTRYGTRIVSVTDGSHRRWLLAIPALMAVGCAAIAASPAWWLTIALMGIVTATDAAIRPETTTRLNQQISSTVRATILSLQNLVMTLYIAALHPAVGAVADATTTAGAFVLLGLLCLLPLLLALPLRSRAARPARAYSA